MMKWYAFYTRPRAEKVSFARLEKAGYNCYLPLRRERRKWSDRIKTVLLPLFTSYIFVKAEEHQLNGIRIEGGLVGYITFEGKPASVADNQIELIKKIVSEAESLEVVPSDMKPGQKIEITGGSLMGVKGELVRHQGSHKVLVRLDEIGQGILFTLDKDQIASRLD